MYNHFTCMFLASVDRKFAGDYDYVAQRYLGFSNVLHIWSVQAIPTYRLESTNSMMHVHYNRSKCFLLMHSTGLVYIGKDCHQRMFKIQMQGKWLHRALVFVWRSIVYTLKI